MTSLQEYDMDINPAKIVKGQGLCKLAAKSKETHRMMMKSYMRKEL
jgi:hypothetical protein